MPTNTKEVLECGIGLFFYEAVADLIVEDDEPVLQFFG
jgi:hypothetical protein